MNSTQGLLTKIANLRQRLEQAQGLVCEAGSEVAALAGNDGGQLETLRHQAALGAEHDALLDVSLRQLTDTLTLDPNILPSRLTSRARRILEMGRDLLGQLRALADQVEDAGKPDDQQQEPLTQMYRQMAAMTDTTLRMVQAFPDAPSAQLRLCQGLEAILSIVAQRIAVLRGVVENRRLENNRIAVLADLLSDLAAGKAIDVSSLAGLAETLLDEVQESPALRFLDAPPMTPAQYVAAHSLTVAQVLARVVRHDPDLSARPTEPILAALVHDVGMLLVPAEILTYPGPLDDAQKRAIEGHTRLGGERLVQRMPDAAWLAEAATGHHERLDGTGYPAGLHDGQIAPLTRLLAVCDVYAAQCSSRPYRAARDPRTALTDTLLLAEQGGLDRSHAERILLLGFYPVGSAVELADGSVGVVVATHATRHDLSNPARPVILLLTDRQGQPRAWPAYLDLAQAEHQSIVRSLLAAERRSLLGARYPEWM